MTVRYVTPAYEYEYGDTITPAIIKTIAYVLISFPVMVVFLSNGLLGLATTDSVPRDRPLDAPGYIPAFSAPRT